MIPSSFGWLDYSEAQRRKMLAILDSFRDKTTIDQLGFGAIDIAFSDHFFPGISTIYTRAKYLLFVPWIYRRIEKNEPKNLSYARLEALARYAQTDTLPRALQREAGHGVIGGVAGQSLKRTPADIYWNGLVRFGIWQFNGSLSRYWSVSQQHAGDTAPSRTDDGDLNERQTVIGWDRNLPNEPKDFLDHHALLSFALTREEAEYLRERLTTGEAGESLLAFCVKSTPRITPIKCPWELPNLPSNFQLDLDRAHRIAIVSLGATLLYDLMVAERASQTDTRVGKQVAVELVDTHRSQLESWTKHAELLGGWRTDDLWLTLGSWGYRIPTGTKSFVEELLKIMQTPRGFRDDREARRIIVLRERFLKGRLAKLTNSQALEQFGGSAGSDNPYPPARWPNAKQIVADIREGVAIRDTMEVSTA